MENFKTTCYFCGASLVWNTCNVCGRTQDEARDELAGYYGNLSRVAIGFYVKTGNPSELLAAVLYAKQAAHVTTL